MSDSILTFIGAFMTVVPPLVFASGALAAWIISAYALLNIDRNLVALIKRLDATKEEPKG